LSDPTGFNIFGDFFNWLNQSLGSTGAQIVISAAAIAVGIVTAGIATAGYAALIGVEVAALQGTLAGAIVGGAGFGFGAGFTGTLLSGASIGQAFQAGAIGGLIGGITGGIAHGIGSMFPVGDGNVLEEMFSFNHLARTVGHAALGGVTSEIQNGHFEEGAISAAASEAFAPVVDNLDYKAERVAASAAIGGTVAELGGGKFANGAVTAAFMRLFNDESGVDRRTPEKWSNKDLTSIPVINDNDIEAALKLTAQWKINSKDVSSMSWIEYGKWLKDSVDTVRPRSVNGTWRSFWRGGFFYYTGGRYGKAGYYNGNAINYIGVGMGLAAGHIPRIAMPGIISSWKIGKYGLTGLQGGEFHWANVGYDYYLQTH
jgi:hypothetical protein